MQETLESALRLFQSGRFAGAAALCEEVLAGAPDNFDALHLLGVIHSQEERFELGVQKLEQALRINPDHAEARANLGIAADRWNLQRLKTAMALHQQGDLSGAEEVYRSVLERDDRNFDALQLLGAIATQTRRPQLALGYLDRALRLKPDYAEVHCNRGNALAALGRLQEALASYDRALEIKPDLAEAHSNRGRAMKDLARYDEALASYERAIALAPDLGEAQWNKALLHLLLGRLPEGWQDYEWRWKKKDRSDSPRTYPQPLWLGDADLRGRRIFIYAEQGYGDTLQFSRFVTPLAALGAEVILEAPAALRRLLEHVPGVSAFVTKGEALPDFDVHCPLLSLPLAFKVTLSSLSGAPYLAAPTSRVTAWQTLLGQGAQSRVGLAWSGNAWHKDDHNRSIPLPRFSQALVKGIDYIRLQKDINQDDRGPLERHPEIRSFDADIVDFADTAALIENLDLVVTVDTSIAHLAGALGKEVWILLPCVPDWRWLLDRDDSPWYDSARLFRQPAPGDWDSVLRKVRERLAARFGLDPRPLDFDAASDAASAVSIESRGQLQVALALHQKGDLPSAEKIYLAVLERNPDDADALHLLGTMAAQRNQPALAIDYLQRALAINPRHIEACNNLGNALRAQNRFEEALASFDRALTLKPDYAEACNNRGNVLKALNRLEEALASYDRAIGLRADYVEAIYNRGNTLRAMGRQTEALSSYDHALALKPDYVAVVINQGNAFRESKRMEEALASYDRALMLKPDYAPVHNNRGHVLQVLGRLDEALAGYDRAIALSPGYAEAYNNRGLVLRAMGRPSEAVASFDQATLCDPALAEAYNNRGVVLTELKRLDEALASFNQAIARVPDYAEAHWNSSFIYLVRGDFETGWKEYEWRWKQSDPVFAPRMFAQPLWLGDADIRGKRVLIYSEQGFGDSIQCCRHLAAVAALGAHVIYEVHPALYPLLKQIPGVAEFITTGDALPEFDLRCPLLSLPLALKLTLDALSGAPYLKAPAERVASWRGRLGDSSRPQVGIVWSGHPDHRNDANRSLPLSRFRQALVAGIDAICLQKDIRPTDSPWLAGEPGIRCFDAALDDFADTAALIENLDLVITVDTSVAHLAGALGKEVWILLPCVPDWRWLLDRDDSPWYDSARLFRQPAPGDWDSVLREVRERLAARFGLDPRPGGGAPAIDGPRSFGFAAAQSVASTTVNPSPVDSSTDPGAELRRRHAAIAARQTDIERWADPRQLEAAWERRASIAAGYLPAGARVLDLGCGAMTLEKHLPRGCSYLPSDIVARDSRTAICDLNRGELPHEPLARCDVVTMLGVLEYVYDVPALLARLAAAGRPLVLSYCPRDNGLSTPRRDLGWVNDYSLEEFSALLCQAGYRIRHRDRIDGVQWLFKAETGARPDVPAPKRVLVLSYNNVGNFGDRLGYHLLNPLLPANAEASYCHFQPWDVPAEDFDLLILGIGNSLFAPLLTDGLLRLMERIPRRIGIFGTQYRSGLPAARLGEVIGLLDHWYARYEEDLLLYGRENAKASHLGDWLIHACPMTRPTREETLRIGDEVWQDQPLDRSIQRFQQFREVHSTRLHPLLCALTSAERVAYEEQREFQGGEPSGKFRSLLLDIFGREFPEREFWPVDRDAVMAYKAQVGENIAGLKARIDALLA